VTRPARETSRAFLAALLTATAAARLALAWTFPGFLSGDDLEIVETAARWAVRLDYSPWPIRSLFHPLLLAFPAVKAGAAVGLASPHWLTFLAAIPTAAFSTLGVWLAYRVALALGGDEATGRAAAFLAATAWVPFAYGATQYPRPISSALLLGAFLLLVRPGERARDAALAGLLAAAAFAVRWSEGVALIPLAGLVLLRDRGLRRALALAAGFAAGVVLFVGAFDAATWGAPFASLRAFLAFMRAPHDAFTPRPPLWYVGMVLQWTGPVLLLLAAFAVRDRRARAPMLAALTFVVLLSPTPLKGLRYLMFAVLLLAVAAAFGWERLRRGGRTGRALATICLAAAVPLCAERTLHLMREKSQPAITAARYLASLEPPVRAAALEQSWAWGDRLYLGNGVRIVDLRATTPLADGALAAAAECDAIGLYLSDASEDVRRELALRGFRESARFADSGGRHVVVFLGNRPRSGRD
jgi:hypothetical protein